MTRAGAVKAVLLLLTVALPLLAMAFVFGLIPASLQQVFIGTPGQAAICYDPATGGERWRAELPGVGTQPVLADGRLFVAGPDLLRVFDTADGALLWTRPSGPFPPVLAGDLAVVSGTGGIAALDAATGTVRWTSSAILTPIGGRVAGGVTRPDIVLGDDRDGGELVALEPADGTVRWRVATGRGRLAGVGEAAYVSYPTGRLEARDLRSGEVMWQAQASADAFVLLTPGRVHTFTGYASEGLIITLDAGTGEEQWSGRFVGSPGFRAAATADTLAAPVRAHELAGLDPATGRVRWRAEQDDSGFTAAAGRRIVLADSDGLQAWFAGSPDRQSPDWRTGISAPSRVHLPLLAAGPDAACVVAGWNQRPSRD